MAGSDIDWNKEAVEHANTIKRDRPDQRVGASAAWVEDDRRTAVLFGNCEGPYDDDPTAKRTVELIREQYQWWRVKEKAFKLDSQEGATWVILVRAADRWIDEHEIERLKSRVQEARKKAEQEQHDPGTRAYEEYKARDGKEDPASE